MFFNVLKENECAHECFFNYSQNNTRQHDGWKIEALKFNEQCDKHNFITGGVTDWNSLPTNISAVSNYNIFKNDILTLVSSVLLQLFLNELFNCP